MPPVRSFLAIPFSPGIIEAACQIQRQIAEEISNGVRWVRPESMHLTLKFFGSIEQEILDEIEKVVLSVGRLQHPFQLQVSGIGAFPSASRPKVLWLGIGGETDVLQQLHSILDAQLAAIGIPADDRPFTPHLTLGRARRSLPPSQTLLAPYRNLSCGTVTVRAITLFESRLRPEGALHTPIKTIEFEER